VKNNRKPTRINFGLIVKAVSLVTLFGAAAIVMGSIQPLILLGVIIGAIYVLSK
jgi:hypothetical protein